MEIYSTSIYTKYIGYYISFFNFSRFYFHKLPAKWRLINLKFRAKYSNKQSGLVNRYRVTVEECLDPGSQVLTKLFIFVIIFLLDFCKWSERQSGGGGGVFWLLTLNSFLYTLLSLYRYRYVFWHYIASSDDSRVTSWTTKVHYQYCNRTINKFLVV